MSRAINAGDFNREPAAGLIGETIAHILEREVDRAPGGTFGAKYLKRATAEFRNSQWMTVEPHRPRVRLG